MDTEGLYRRWILLHPHASLWQSPEWKGYQEALGKDVRIYTEKEGEEIVCSALVIIDRTAFGYATWDIPRGPLWKEGSDEAVARLMVRIQKDAQSNRALSFTFSPPILLPKKVCTYITSMKKSPRHEMPEATRIINLKQSEKDILSHMKQKGRYNIKVAQRHGVTVTESSDISSFYAMLTETAVRDGFRIHPKRRYETFTNTLPGSFLLIAEDASKNAIAGLLGVLWNKTGIFYFGASKTSERAKMAPYLLQWEAMRYCMHKGADTYDLFGIAPLNAPRNHPWRGISQFKEKFGGEVCVYPPEIQITLKHVTQTLLKIKRALVG